MTQTTATAQQDPQAQGQVFLLTDAGILVQEQGTSLWRSLPLPAEAAARPTAAQLRSLRHAPEGRRPGQAQAPRPQGQAPTSQTLEIYNPLTATWAAVPNGAARAQVGEAVCCLLPDGRLLIGGPGSASCATYDPAAQRWSTAPAQPSGARRQTTGGSVIVIRLCD